jgi:hypothetical protein
MNLSLLPTIRQKKDKNKSSPSTSPSPSNIINGAGGKGQSNR